ncbi:caspase family protein [Bacteroidota bacterium]
MKKIYKQHYGTNNINPKQIPMKNIIITIVAIIFAFSSIPKNSFADKDPTKHALIIAVADYPEEGRWPDISSDNDVSLIRGALLNQGFDNDNIKIVLDEQASKDMLVEELIALSGKVKKGDIVVIHYSGHGQQIEDNNKDEIDGWDEAIIPWDAQIRWTDEYQGEKHLRDDEINTLTDNIRKELGTDGNLLLILDACHSGTGNRGGLATSRGTSLKFSKKGYKPGEEEDKGNFSDISKIKDEKLATMVTISGASQHELNYEYYDHAKDSSYGSLSYAFSKAITEANKETTYRGLFDHIKVIMSTIAPRQSPQIEGDVDYILFGGDVVEAKPYFMLKDYWDEKNVSINAGILQGIYDNSEVAFYPIGTLNPEKIEAIATGKIINAMAIESDVELDESIDKETISKSWAYITKQNFGDNDLNVLLNIKDDNEIKDKLIAKLNDMPKVKLVSTNPDLVIDMNNKYTRGNNIQLITADEMELYFENIGSNTSSDKIVNNVIEEINYFMQVNLLKKIEMTDEALDVSFELIPVTVKKVGRRYEIDQRLDINDMRNSGNELEFTESDYFIIKVRNDGYKRAYFQILDIRPNNQVTLLYPQADDPRPSSEFTIGMDEEKEIGSIFFFEKPYGNEYLKLIATAEPIDMRFIIKSRGADSRGPGDMSPFEQLLQDSYKGTRAGSLSVPPGSATVYTIPIKVVEK